jgi:hypothetical protein
MGVEMSDEIEQWEAFRDRANIEDQTMMWDETHEVFEERLRELYAEFAPVGVTEEDLVLRMAKLRWDRHRLDRFAQLKMHSAQIELRTKNKISHMAEKLKALAPEFLKAKTVKEVESLFSKHPDLATTIRSSYPLEKCKYPNTWGGIIAEGLAGLEPAKRFEGHEEFLKMVAGFPIVQQLDMFERFDAINDRTIKRLMQVKAMKQMHRELEPKLIGSSHSKKPYKEAIIV